MAKPPIIGVLETGRPPEELADYGDYPGMVADWLGRDGVTYRSYAVLKGVLPDAPEEADLWVITGSKFGAYEDHDWIGSVTYRGVQNEVFFQMSLKAFPLRPVKIGPDPSLPILPANITNAFTR